jgi:hypothetical protein
VTFTGRIAAVATLALAVLVTAAQAQESSSAPPAAPADSGSSPPIVAPAPAAGPAPGTAPPPSQGVPTADEEAAAVAQLLGQDGAAEGERGLKLYGFADFNAVGWLNLSDRWKANIPTPLTFFVGRVNLYLEGDIAPDWKSLMEVRYMFLPNGARSTDVPLDPIGNTGRFDGFVADYADNDRPVAWGGISIQRVQLEHTFTSFLTVRVGRFLTPWGIWNVDHGSPVIIGVSKPYLIGDGFFPEAQTGFDAFGSAAIGDSTLGYHLTLSNGRGPTEAFRDLDSNKAVGGRLNLRMSLLGEVEVGVSGYGGTVTDQRRQIDLKAGALSYFNYERYRERSWAADLRWTWKSLRLQVEAAFQDRVWDDDARPVVGVGVQKDVRRAGTYALLAYRLPWFNLMPFVMYQYYDTGDRQTFGGLADEVTSLQGGLNIRLNPSVVFKIEYIYGSFGGVVPGSLFEDPIQQLSSQLAWAF